MMRWNEMTHLQTLLCRWFEWVSGPFCWEPSHLSRSERYLRHTYENCDPTPELWPLGSLIKRSSYDWKPRTVFKESRSNVCSVCWPRLHIGAQDQTGDSGDVRRQGNVTMTTKILPFFFFFKQLSLKPSILFMSHFNNSYTLSWRCSDTTPRPLTSLVSDSQTPDQLKKLNKTDVISHLCWFVP